MPTQTGTLRDEVYYHRADFENLNRISFDRDQMESFLIDKLKKEDSEIKASKFGSNRSSLSDDSGRRSGKVTFKPASFEVPLLQVEELDDEKAKALIANIEPPPRRLDPKLSTSKSLPCDENPVASSEHSNVESMLSVDPNSDYGPSSTVESSNGQQKRSTFSRSLSNADVLQFDGNKFQ